MDSTRKALLKAIRLSRMKFEAGMISKEKADRQLNRCFRMALTLNAIDHPRSSSGNLQSMAQTVRLSGGRVKRGY